MLERPRGRPGEKPETRNRQTMEAISDGYGKLIESGVPMEDAANILLLGMASKINYPQDKGP